MVQYFILHNITGESGITPHESNALMLSNIEMFTPSEINRDCDWPLSTLDQVLVGR